MANAAFRVFLVFACQLLAIAAAIDYGHSIGLKIHAWASINEDDHGWGWASEFSKAHPEFRWLRRDGWHVEHRGGTGDGGIDILARRRKETLAVQCKRYAESAAVSAAQVRDLYGAAVATGATAAVLITTGRVSGPAVAWAETLPPGPALTFHDLNCLGNLAAGNTRL